MFDVTVIGTGMAGMGEIVIGAVVLFERADMTVLPITVYYDGLCPLCSREIAHYRARAKGAPVTFVDITTADFDPLQHGVDPGRIHQFLHVKAGDEMCIGTEAFIALWEAIPTYRWLARLARFPGVHAVANAAYRIFASFRPYLQRRTRNLCSTETCRRQ